ncbi:MAG: Crp/Fnr family transcriptional regulator [Betaproteobacteria bacterium]|jgi:CRP/FNR family cyclic AMP-dependent transcriptional regulator|nr:MAG: Crp/Fnr family transcriptional regulator [Betaproteobacteria bacterium]
MLKDVGGFEGLSDEQIGLLTNRAAVRTYSKGAIIVSEGDEGNSLFVIQSGSVKAFLSDENGKEVVLSTQGPGEYFGDLALFDDEPRSASIMALEPCKVMIITKSQLRDAIKDDPEIGFSLLHGLAKRVRILTENVRTMALLDVFGRLVKTLYMLAEEKEGGLVIDQRLTQQDLANRIGASREMVSRIMHDLTEGGYLSIKAKRITILKKIPSNW